ncbi:MAG: methyltransferase domain-containing protein [Candidatus Omnitrophota bacterium]|jgi:SAM-dependent methyltransferase
MLSRLLKEHIQVDIARMRKKDFLKFMEEHESEVLKRIMARHGRKEVRECPLCGSSEFTEELIKDDSPLVRCHRCELRYHQKIPRDLMDVYGDSDKIIYPMDDTEGHYEYRRERFGKERVRLLERHCGNLSNKKILDVGCGNGFFLSALKETGAECVGSELSEQWRQFTGKKTGLRIYGDPLESFPVKDFDILTMFDVIEHLEKPVPFMAAACKLLKPKGHILVYTPNFDSFSLRVMGKCSNNIGPNEHLILFSYPSLETLGRLTGLTILHKETRGLDIHSILSYQDYLDVGRDPFLTQWGDELQAMIDAAGCGDYIRVIYSKA